MSLITPERLHNRAKRMMFLALTESVFFTMFEIHTNVRIFITLSFVSPSRYLWIITLYKVNRCLARYSPRAITTSQPTNRAPNEPALNKNANFGPTLVLFGKKILFFTGEVKSFVPFITENPPRHLVRIVFWSGGGRK